MTGCRSRAKIQTQKLGAAFGSVVNHFLLPREAQSELLWTFFTDPTSSAVMIEIYTD